MIALKKEFVLSKSFLTHLFFQKIIFGHIQKVFSSKLIFVTTSSI